MSSPTRLVGARPGPLAAVPLPPADAWDEAIPEVDEAAPCRPPRSRAPGDEVVQVVQLTDFAERVRRVLPSLPAAPSAHEIYLALTTDPRLVALYYRCDETRIGLAMRELGFRPRQRTEGGRRLRRFELRGAGR